MIEQTSKGIKLGILVSAVVMLAGLAATLWAVPNRGDGGETYMAASIAVAAVGLCGYTTFRVLAWWHHG
jgi:hypothetical protein